MSRLIDADALEKDGWMMHRTVQVDKATMSYQTKKPTDFPTIEPEPCEDAVSRQALLDGLASIAKAKAKSDAQKALIGRTMFFAEQLPSVKPERETGKWIPVTRIETWEEETGLTGFPQEVAEFPHCTIKWVEATEPDEVDAVKCSECGEVFDFQDARNWCTECGARMSGGKQPCN